MALKTWIDLGPVKHSFKYQSQKRTIEASSEAPGVLFMIVTIVVACALGLTTWGTATALADPGPNSPSLERPDDQGDEMGQGQGQGTSRGGPDGQGTGRGNGDESSTTTTPTSTSSTGGGSSTTISTIITTTTTNSTGSTSTSSPTRSSTTPPSGTVITTIPWSTTSVPCVCEETP